MNKEEILTAIKECAQKLGHAPSYPELRSHFQVSEKAIRKLFGRYRLAIQECGLVPHGPGHEIPMENLFRDWAAIVRKTGQIPSQSMYECMSKHSVNPLTGKFRSWLNVPHAMRQFAESNGLQEEFADVLDVISARPKGEAEGAPRSAPMTPSLYKAPLLKHRPIYGPPLMPAALACGPVNEMGVVYLFALLAARLGFVVTRIQTDFPDCEALRRVDEERWQKIWIEFEYESRNFLKHMHKIQDCDLIVCWSNNWPECPIEVLELRSVVKQIAGAEGVVW